MDLGYRQTFYSVGMKGVQRENAAAVEQLILDTLAGLARERHRSGHGGASLNTVEFHLREMNTGRFPRGLAVMLYALDTWLYDGDPFAALRIDAPLARRSKSDWPLGERYFENLIAGSTCVANPHRVTVILEPDPELAERRADAETAAPGAGARRHEPRRTGSRGRRRRTSSSAARRPPTAPKPWRPSPSLTLERSRPPGAPHPIRS